MGMPGGGCNLCNSVSSGPASQNGGGGASGKGNPLKGGCGQRKRGVGQKKLMV